MQKPDLDEITLYFAARRSTLKPTVELDGKRRIRNALQVLENPQGVSDGADNSRRVLSLSV